MAERRPGTVSDARWNHNIAYHDVILSAVPDGCRRAIDVGCGDGMLTRALSDRAAHVTGLDVDPGCVERTRAEVADLDNVEVVLGDVMAVDLEPRSFDAVLAVASLHHLELEAGLRRLAELVAPGGVLGLVGLARSRSSWDVAHDAVGMVATRMARRRHRWWEHAAPLVDPSRSYSEVLREATMVLPGCRYRRHVLFRWSLVWTRPT